jgi:LmbE family N-acetylglucosaminyl deacetylase
MPLALALSPHLDDAAFSAGATLASLAEAGWEVVVATIFTATIQNPSGFALACQTDKGLAPDVDYMAMRRAEDAQACAVLGAQPVWLALAEAPHRGYGSAAELFDEPHARDSADRDAAAAIGPLLDMLRPNLLLAPQAIGGHVDHVQVARAVQRVQGEAPVLWWQDFPYLARADTPLRPFEPLFAELPETTMRGDDARKREACAAYATQLGYQFGGTEGLHRALAATGGLECFRLQGDLVLSRAA